MTSLKEFSPCLVGSVWRGTARRNSDIDIYAFAEDHFQVIRKLLDHNNSIKSTEQRSITKDGKKESSFHIHIILNSRDKLEVVVRRPCYLGQLERCETYGDIKIGLSLNQVEKILRENPLQKFIPRYKNRS